MKTVRLDDIDLDDGFRNCGEQWRGTLDEFLANNETLNEQEIYVLRSMPVGASFVFGGGAAASFRLERLT